PRAGGSQLPPLVARSLSSQAPETPRSASAPPTLPLFGTPRLDPVRAQAENCCGLFPGGRHRGSTMRRRARLSTAAPLVSLVFALTAAPPAHASLDRTWYHPGVGPDLSLQSATFDAMPDLPASFTVEFWFRAGQQVQGAFPVLCAKPAGNMLAGEASYAFILINGNGNLIFRVTTDTGNFEIQYPHNLLDNQWHHVAGVRTVGSTARIYLFVDGRPYDYLSIVGTALTSTEPLCIGRLEFTGYTGNQFDGDLDELRLWGVARSAAEIDRDRFREISSAPGLIVAFHFDGFYETDSGQRIHLGTPFPEKATHVNPAGAGGLLSGPDGAPVVPGSGFDGSQSFRTVGGKTASDVRYMHAAAMSGGQFVALGKQTAARPVFLD